MTAARQLPGRIARSAVRNAGTVCRGGLMSAVAVLILVPLTLLALVLVPLGVGIVLMQAVFDLTEFFARYSRGRALDGSAAGLRRRPSEGSREWSLAALGDASRWQDLLSEAVISPVVRIGSLIVAASWAAGAVAGLTFPLWGLADIPGVDGPAGPNPWANVALGVAATLLLPALLWLLARLDFASTAATLGRVEVRGESRPGTLPARPSRAPIVERPPGIGGWSPRNWGPGDWGLAVAGFVGVAMVAIGWPVFVVYYGMPVMIAMLVTLAHSLALVLSVTRPVPGNALAVVALVPTVVLADAAPGMAAPFPVTTMLVQWGIVALVFGRNSWTVALPSLVAPLFLAVLAVVLEWPDAGKLSNAIVFASIAACVALVGGVFRQWWLSRRALEREREETAVQSAGRRELEERNRIARELHDVVAHSMSVISVQASTARYRYPDVDERTVGEFESIAGAARQALGEMRSLLSLLRSDDEAMLTPQPTLGDVAGLVAASMHSGAVIELDSDVNQSVPPATATTAYRAVQEGLSNALRHAPGSHVSVAVRTVDGTLCVDVVNGPPGAAQLAPIPGSGLGLAGIRERVMALGGTLVTGPEGNGFGVHIWLPLM